METTKDRDSIMTKDVNANVVKTLNNKEKAKQTDLRDVIRKYLDNPTNSKSAINPKDHKEDTNIESKGIGSQKERKEQIENVTDSLSLKMKSTTTDVSKDLNCQYVSKDAEKCVNIFNEIVESKIFPGHAPNKDRNLENHSHVESSFNRFGNAEKLRIPGTSLKVANLDVFMEEGSTEMIGKDIAAKLNEPRVDMVVALVGVIGTEDALRIFKETQKVEAGGGLMIKNGARRRTAGGTFLQLIREIESPNVDMEEVNSVFERFNEVEKMDSDRVEKKVNVKLDRPCDYFNDTGMCKFKSGHFSQSGFTRRIHSCRFCFYRHEVENGHPEIHCGLYRSYLNNIDSTFQPKEERSNKLRNGDVARQFKATSIEKILTGSNVMPIGIRPRPTEDRKKHREIVEQENMGSNSARSSIMSVARSAIMSAKAEGGTTSQTELRPPSTTRDMSKSKIEMSGNERSKKMVQIQNSFGREKDMKKAKEKLTMLSDQISKSVFTEHQDYQAKKELELVEVHSSVGKSRLSLQTHELAINCKIELAMDCKIESQNGKDRKKKGKSCGKCIDEIQGKDKRGEIFEKNVEKKKFSEDVNRGKNKNIEAEKREDSESSQEKHYNKAKRKENNEKKKEIVKNKSMEDTAEEKEKTDKEIKGNPNLEANKLCTFPTKTPRKENYHCNINEEGSGRKEQLFNKKDKEQTQIAEITPKMEKMIQKALKSRTKVLIDRHNIRIGARDIRNLAGLNWLNDEIINFYLQMIVERGARTGVKIHAYSTFFYPKLMTGGHTSLRRWTKKVNIFAQDLLLIPVHLGIHWSLAVVDFGKSGVFYYDSMGGDNPECFAAILKYLQDEHRIKKEAELDVAHFEARTLKGVPQQMNGSDCGVFLLKFAEYVSRGADLNFTQKDMPAFRKIIIWEILNDQLLQ